jgi:hypothetical protein
MWFTGIDWADTHHDIVILEESGQKLTSFRVPHTPEGLAELTSRLEAVCGPGNKAAMACIILHQSWIVDYDVVGGRFRRLSGQSQHRRSQTLGIESQNRQD